MNKLLASTAGTALLATSVPMDLSVSDGDLDYVQLNIAYDVFNLQDTASHELAWRPEARLVDYLDGLPTECEWVVLVNAVEVDMAVEGNRKLARLDQVTLILLPQGGGGMKKILMAVAAVAMIAVGIFVPGMQWMLYAGISMAMGLVSQMLMMPKTPKTGARDEDSNSYGIDGAKNSATEGIPYPVLYGEFRFAGNYSNCYTVNVGDDQYLYVRTILNDGEIDSISDIEINEQPIANFVGVETRLFKGSLDQTVNDWFSSSIVQYNKGVALTGLTNVAHTTTSAVDRVRLDFVFPAGLANINLKDGSKGNWNVPLKFEHRLQGTLPWLPMPISNDSSSAYNSGGAPVYTGFLGAILSLVVKTETATAAETPQTVTAVNTVTSEEHTLATITPTAAELEGYAITDSGAAFGGGASQQFFIQRRIVAELPDGNYDIVVSDGTQLVSGTASPAAPVPSLPPESLNPTGEITFTDKRAKAIRKSVMSGPLVKGIYEVRVRRTVAENPGEDKLDDCILTDVAEIESDPVALRGTASLSLKVKLNDQLNAIPQLTSKVKASLVRTYDIEGNQLTHEWSDNPAWISLDILLSPERGAMIDPNRIDWPRWVEFAEWCVANSITFNGAFDQGTNLGDALRDVMRVGHAMPVPFGTKISVAIDRPRTPVHVFTQGNILKDTFQISYLSMQDRANEYEFSYFDKTDRNKQKSIRYVDPKAVQFAETPRAASVVLQGVDNLAQATKEMWKAIYQNRLILRSVQFDSWLDSINMTMGEVALIHHDMMEWANSGRLAEGSTSLILKLDQSVVLDGASSALIHFDALQVGSTTVSSVVGRKLLVDRPSASDFSASQLVAKRVIINGEDYEVASIVNGAVYHTITLAGPATGIGGGDAVQLWDTDVVFENAVSAVSDNPDGTSSVTLTTPLPEAPKQYANFAFGKVAMVRRPYTLVGITGNGLEKRKLSFMEYNEDIYGPAEVEIPIPVAAVSDRIVPQARGLVVSFDQIVEANRALVPVTILWKAGHIINYAGADIYMAVNGEAMSSIGSAVATSEHVVQLSPADRVEFRVVPFNKHGNRAPYVLAPSVETTIVVAFAELDPVTAMAITDVAFEVDGKVAVSWTNPVDMLGIQNFETQYKRVTDSVWTSLGYVGEGPVEISGLPTGNYEARVRSNSVTSTSVWVEDTFTVAVAPGSLMANFNSGNDRNGAAIGAPTLPGTGAVEHTLNLDGSANLSLDWIWGGSEATIDGFEVKVDRTPPAP